MPRKGHFLQGLVISVLLAMPAMAEQQGFRWQHDVETAKKLAQQSGRLVLVHFWTPSCGPCIAMEQSVFNQPGVAGAIETYFVPVKLNAEQHAATAHAYGVTRIPSDVVLSANGTVIGKMVSPLTPAAYVAELTQVATRLGAKAQPYTGAAADAPQPSHWNPAYASLPVSEAYAPSATSPFPGSPGDQYTQSQFLPSPPAPPSQPAASTAPANTLFGAPTATGVGTAYGPIAYQQPQAPSTALPQSTLNAPAAAPGAQAPQSTDNRYAQMAPSAVVATAPSQASPEPNQFDNPYTFGAPTHPTADQATQPASYAAVPAPAASAFSQVPSEIAAPPQTTVAGSVATPDGRLLPPGAPPLGFEGFCPVSMRTSWKWVAGDPKWGAIHRGRTYWFIGQAEQQQFLANPDYYSPALSGIDPVLAIDHRQAVPGEREHSIDYDNQFYLFSSEATLQQFTSNPERYATGVRQAMGLQPTRTVR